MKILVLGCKGQLGRCLNDQLTNTGHEVIYTSREQIDIGDFEVTKNQILEISPDLIINATAYTAVDKAEEDQKTANLINHLAVKNIADICNQFKCWLIHVSTDYVFDGALDRPYTPSDMTNPLNVYGQSKLAGEQLIDAVGCIYSIVRTSWLYSHYGNNFYTKLLAQVNAGKTLRVTADQNGCPTRAEDLAGHLLTGIANQELAKGISHYCGGEVMTWLDLARRLFPNQEILEWSGRNSHTVRPKKVVLKNNKS